MFLLHLCLFAHLIFLFIDHIDIDKSNDRHFTFNTMQLKSHLLYRFSLNWRVNFTSEDTKCLRSIALSCLKVEKHTNDTTPLDHTLFVSMIPMQQKLSIFRFFISTLGGPQMPLKNQNKWLPYLIILFIPYWKVVLKHRLRPISQKKSSQQQLKKTRMKKKILADDDYAYLYLSLSRLVNKDSSLRAMHTIIPSTRRNSRPSHVVQAK